MSKRDSRLIVIHGDHGEELGHEEKLCVTCFLCKQIKKESMCQAACRHLHSKILHTPDGRSNTRYNRAPRLESTRSTSRAPNDYYSKRTRIVIDKGRVLVGKSTRTQIHFNAVLTLGDKKYRYMVIPPIKTTKKNKVNRDIVIVFLDNVVEDIVEVLDLSKTFFCFPSGIKSSLKHFKLRTSKKSIALECARGNNWKISDVEKDSDDEDEDEDELSNLGTQRMSEISHSPIKIQSQDHNINTQPIYVHPPYINYSNQAIVKSIPVHSKNNQYPVHTKNNQYPINTKNSQYPINTKNSQYPVHAKNNQYPVNNQQYQPIQYVNSQYQQPSNSQYQQPSNSQYQQPNNSPYILNGRQYNTNFNIHMNNQYHIHNQQSSVTHNLVRNQYSPKNAQNGTTRKRKIRILNNQQNTFNQIGIHNQPVRKVQKITQKHSVKTDQQQPLVSIIPKSVPKQNLNDNNLVTIIHKTSSTDVKAAHNNNQSNEKKNFDPIAALANLRRVDSK